MSEIDCYRQAMLVNILRCSSDTSSVLAQIFLEQMLPLSLAAVVMPVSSLTLNCKILGKHIQNHCCKLGL